MLNKIRCLGGIVVAAALPVAVPAWCAEEQNGSDAATGDGAVIKAVVRAERPGENALRPENWQPWEKGYQRQGNEFLCENGADSAGRRGAFQRVVLNQAKARPIVASAWSKAVAVSGTADADYSIWIDLTFEDGTKKWGQSASFQAGTHDWQQARLEIYPDRPVKVLTFNLLLREHSGQASFREPELATHRLATPNRPSQRSSMRRRTKRSCGTAPSGSSAASGAENERRRARLWRISSTPRNQIADRADVPAAPSSTSINGSGGLQLDPSQSSGRAAGFLADPDGAGSVERPGNVLVLAGSS